MLRARFSLAVLLLAAACSSTNDDTLTDDPANGSPADGGSGSSVKPDAAVQDAAVAQDAAVTEDAGVTQDAADAQEEAGSADVCPDGFPRGTASPQRLVQAFSPALEGVAVCPNGDVFVSQPETASIFRVPLDGSAPELWTTIPGHQPLGIDCASDGVLYAADFGSTDASVFRISAKNDPGTALPKISGDGGYKAMNGVAAVKGVGVYATDASNTISGRIVLFAEKSPGVFEASVVKGKLPFPNDVAYNGTTNTLDATVTVNAQVYSYPVLAGGALGSQTIPWTGTLGLDALDGLTLSESNDRYVARYLKNFVSRTSDNKTVATMKSPKSLAFRGGTLLVTGDTGLFAVDLAICGASR